MWRGLFSGKAELRQGDEVDGIFLLDVPSETNFIPSLCCQCSGVHVDKPGVTLN